MKIKNVILFIINIFIAITIIGYIVYRRLFVIRLPKELYFIQNNSLKYSLIFLVISSILFCALNLILILISMKKKKSDNMVTRMGLKITNKIDEALAELYNFCGGFIPDVYDKISYLALQFYTYAQEYSEAVLLYILYAIRSIILLCFFMDIFIFFKLKYMYSALYLLVISLIIKLYIYILKDFIANLNEIESSLIITDKGIHVETGLPITSYRLKDEYKHMDLNYNIEQYILCKKLTGYFDYYQRYNTLFYPYANIAIYSVYLIGWSYVVIYNF